jgi:integrase
MKAKRTQIAPNIFEYADGRREIRMTVAGRRAPSVIFAAGTPLATIEARRDAERDRLGEQTRGRGEAPRGQRSKGGTLDSWEPEFCSLIAGRESFKADRSHFRAWRNVDIDGVRLGSLSPLALTAQQMQKAIAQWQTKPSAHVIRTVVVTAYARPACQIAAYDAAGAKVRAHKRHGRRRPIAGYERSGTVVAAHARRANSVPSYERSAPATSLAVVSARTIRHRCRVLNEFFLKCGLGPSPLRGEGVAIPKRPRRGVPVTVTDAIMVGTLRNLAALDEKTFARFAVAATTGQRPCQIGRTRPEDVSLEHPVHWMVPPAKEEDAHPVDLSETAIDAWRCFIQAEAWGAFDTSKYGKLIHEAGWPKGIRPYNARHTMAATMLKLGCSLGDVQAQFGHKDPNTTRIYAPFVRERQREVSSKMSGYLAEVFRPRLVKKGGR